MNLVTGRIILHADDLGMSPTVTDGILVGFDEGLLTSTSLLANGPDAARALACWKRLETRHAASRIASVAARRLLDDPPIPFDLGIHWNLTQGRPLDDRFPDELLDPHGCFLGIFGLFRRLLLRPGRFRQAIEAELARQIEFVLDHQIRPTHVNGHQYIEVMPALAPIAVDLARRFHLPVVRLSVESAWIQGARRSPLRPWRWLPAAAHYGFARRFARRLDAAGLAHSGQFFGIAAAGQIDLKRMTEYIAGLDRAGTAEVALHPALAARTAPAAAVNGWHDPLANDRPNELALLCSPELTALLQNHDIRLGRLSALASADPRRWTTARPTPATSPARTDQDSRVA